jgi:TM2 domain-containing membrane protein YozV
MKSRGTAAVLALLLGGIGAHKFYLGRGGQGVLYLVFCWTFIPALIALVDFVMLLVMSDESFNRAYNSAVQVMVVAAPAPASAPDVPGQIAALHNLVKSGALTESEFQQRKQRLLAS